MKYILLTTFALSFAFPAHAMKETTRQKIKNQLQEIRAVIAETIEDVKKSSFSRPQKQALHIQLSTVQAQHNALQNQLSTAQTQHNAVTQTFRYQEKTNEKLAAELKALHQLALEQHKETLRIIEEAEKEDAKFCFFEPKDELLGSAKAALLYAVEVHEFILSKQSAS